MSNTTLAEDVLTVLSTLEIDGNNVRITAQLDRKLYQAVNKVLQRIGGKWNRKAKAHVFDDDPTDRLNNVIECGVLDPKVKTGYYPTPAPVVDRMIELADINPTHLVLEPSAGQGHIADKLIKITENVFVCENLEENYRVLDSKHIACCGEFFGFAEQSLRVGRMFDRIVMNPPFAPRQSDIEHVTMAFNLLAPNGILVAIMSAGVTFRENKKTVEFREKILEPNCTYLEHLPVGAFRESGTMVNTVMLRLVK